MIANNNAHFSSNSESYVIIVIDYFLSLTYKFSNEIERVGLIQILVLEYVRFLVIVSIGQVDGVFQDDFYLFHLAYLFGREIALHVIQIQYALIKRLHWLRHGV